MEEKINVLKCIMVCEGDIDSDEQEYYDSWQYLIDTGIVWHLQGWFGRQASALVESGHCFDIGPQGHLNINIGRSAPAGRD